MAFFKRMDKQADEKSDLADEQTPGGKRVLRLKEFLKSPVKKTNLLRKLDVSKEVYEDGFLRFETPSATTGASIGKVVPMRNAEGYIRKGKQFCGITVWLETNWGIPNLPFWDKLGYGDIELVPDMDTLSVVGYQPEMCRVICDQVISEGVKAPCPRTVCKEAMAQLKNEFGLELLAASEFEFQLLRKKSKEELAAEAKQEIPNDEGADWTPCWNEFEIFSTRESMKQMQFVREFEKSFYEMGVDLNAIHTEYAPGQVEISIKPALGISAADNAFTYKTGIKEIADKRKILATFMTKPFGAKSIACSNGGHFNHSLWKTTKSGVKKNVFYKKEGELSDIARWWIGGIFKHHDALCAMANPTVNCYDRLKDFSWAPTRESWGMDNRTVLVRAQARSEHACYLEYRAPSAAQNPYNLYAAIVLAGMDGLRNKINPGPPTGNGYTETDKKHIPETLDSSLKYLEKSELFIDAFGKDYIEMYCTVKRKEIADLEESEKKMGKIRAQQQMYISNA